MHDDLTTAVDELMPAIRDELDALVRIDSVSAPDFDPARVRHSAEASAAQLEAAGFQGVRLLELEGRTPRRVRGDRGPTRRPNGPSLCPSRRPTSRP